MEIDPVLLTVIFAECEDGRFLFCIIVCVDAVFDAGRLRVLKFANYQDYRIRRIKMFDTKACGSRIRELRRNQNITQEELANRLHISDAHLRRVESGKKGASLDLMLAMADVFGVSIDYLVRGYQHPEDHIKRDLCDVIDRLADITKRL